MGAFTICQFYLHVNITECINCHICSHTTCTFFSESATGNCSGHYVHVLGTIESKICTDSREQNKGQAQLTGSVLSYSLREKIFLSLFFLSKQGVCFIPGHVVCQKLQYTHSMCMGNNHSRKDIPGVPLVMLAGIWLLHRNTHLQKDPLGFFWLDIPFPASFTPFQAAPSCFCPLIIWLCAALFAYFTGPLGRKPGSSFLFLGTAR